MGFAGSQDAAGPHLVVKPRGTYSETSYNLLLDMDAGEGQDPSDFMLGQLVGGPGG